MNLERFLFPLRKLREDKVSYVIIGGLAVVLHGHMRLTMDIDLAVSLDDDNVRRLTNSLQQLGFEPRMPLSLDDFGDPGLRADWLRNKNMKALNLWCPPDPFSALDLVFDLPISYVELERESIGMALDEVEVKVASPAHLIQMKEIAGRDTDRSDIEALRAIIRNSHEKE